MSYDKVQVINLLLRKYFSQKRGKSIHNVLESTLQYISINRIGFVIVNSTLSKVVAYEIQLSVSKSNLVFGLNILCRSPQILCLKHYIDKVSNCGIMELIDLISHSTMSSPVTY